MPFDLDSLDIAALPAGLWTALVVTVGAVAGLVGRWGLLALSNRVFHAKRARIGDMIAKSLRGPLILILPIFGVQIALSTVPLDERFALIVRRGLTMVLIGSLGWLVISIINAVGRYIGRRYADRASSPFAQRSLNTRIHLLTRISSVLVGVLAAAVMLMMLPSVRELGTSILASAGIAGIIAGLAAQSVLGNLLAGVQLALTEPIRLGDAVVIDNEFGTIEQIGSSFVIVRTWDLRRLIVPLNFFLQNRFQNWTLTSSDLLGSAIMYVDYAAPIDALREEFHRILEASSHWDRKVAVLQVTDTTERSVQIRALMSAGDPGTLWNLRCEVREKLLLFMQQQYPSAAPRLRAETASLAVAAGAYE